MVIRSNCTILKLKSRRKRFKKREKYLTLSNREIERMQKRFLRNVSTSGQWEVTPHWMLHILRQLSSSARREEGPGWGQVKCVVNLAQFSSHAWVSQLSSDDQWEGVGSMSMSDSAPPSAAALAPLARSSKSAKVCPGRGNRAGQVCTLCTVIYFACFADKNRCCFLLLFLG